MKIKLITASSIISLIAACSQLSHQPSSENIALLYQEYIEQKDQKLHSNKQYSTTLTLPNKSPSHKLTLVISGDSWVSAETQNSPLVAPARGIIQNLNMRIGNRLNIINVAGGSGERLDQIAARHNTDVLAYSPTFHVLIGGENDLAQNRTARQMFASTKSIIDSDIAAGIIPIVFPAQATEASFGSNSAAAIQSRINQWLLYNRMLSTYSLHKLGWIYLSKAFDGVIDHTFSEKLFGVREPALRKEYQLDIGHVNHAGAFRIAKDAAHQLRILLPTIDAISLHDNYKNPAGHNPMMKTSGTAHGPGIAGGTGIVGTPPEGWYARINGKGNGTCNISQIARTDISGANWFRAACSSMQANQSIEFRESDTTAFNYIEHQVAEYGYAVGDVIEIYAEIKVHSIRGTVIPTGTVNNINMRAQILTSTRKGLDVLSANLSESSSSPYLGSDFENEILILSTTRYTIPDTATAWYLWFIVAIQNGAIGDSDFIFELGRIGTRKIS